MEKRVSILTSGVPQGSILGPMLFLLFINDHPDVIPQAASTGLYADDAKLYRAITSNEDSACLQTALTCAEVWSADSNIAFNTSKCKIMTISRRRNPLIANYHLGSADLKRVDSEVDLGITWQVTSVRTRVYRRLLAKPIKRWVYWEEHATS